MIRVSFEQGCFRHAAHRFLSPLPGPTQRRKISPFPEKNPLKDLDRHRRFIKLGRGVVDFWGCWQALQQHGFSGWIVVDLDYTRLTREESCRLNKLYLNEILGIRGERDRHSADGDGIW